MKLVALKHLRRDGGGPRIERGSEFDDSECVLSEEELLSEGFAKKAEEKIEEEPLKDDLYEKAQKLGIKGRSTMTKEELAEAVEDPENIERWRSKQKELGRSK